MFSQYIEQQKRQPTQPATDPSYYLNSNNHNSRRASMPGGYVANPTMPAPIPPYLSQQEQQYQQYPQQQQQQQQPYSQQPGDYAQPVPTRYGAPAYAQYSQDRRSSTLGGLSYAPAPSTPPPYAPYSQGGMQQPSTVFRAATNGTYIY
jgi:hypothetical protein